MTCTAQKRLRASSFHGEGVWLCGLHIEHLTNQLDCVGGAVQFSLAFGYAAVNSAHSMSNDMDCIWHLARTVVRSGLRSIQILGVHFMIF